MDFVAVRTSSRTDAGYLSARCDRAAELLIVVETGAPPQLRRDHPALRFLQRHRETAKPDAADAAYVLLRARRKRSGKVGSRPPEPPSRRALAARPAGARLWRSGPSPTAAKRPGPGQVPRIDHSDRAVDLPTIDPLGMVPARLKERDGNMMRLNRDGATTDASRRTASSPESPVSRASRRGRRRTPPKALPRSAGDRLASTRFRGCASPRRQRDRRPGRRRCRHRSENGSSFDSYLYDRFLLIVRYHLPFPPVNRLLEIFSIADEPASNACRQANESLARDCRNDTANRSRCPATAQGSASPCFTAGRVSSSFAGSASTGGRSRNTISQQLMLTAAALFAIFSRRNLTPRPSRRFRIHIPSPP